MTQQQKLQEIIEETVKSGFNPTDFVVKMTKIKFVFDHISDSDRDIHEVAIENGLVSDLIFSHEFLRSYFGEEQIEWPVSEKIEQNRFGYRISIISIWQYHAQQLAITPEDQRINYLYKFINR